MSHQQVAGFKSLLQRKEDLSISVSDKGGEFVVLENDIQRQLTENHLSSSLGVYKPVPPTRKHLGHTRVIARPTNMSYGRQIKSLTVRLQSKANTLWKKICNNRNLDKNVEVALLSSNTQLPTMYVLLKTHKFRVSEISSSEDVIDTCKVRPIVSCCNGPSEKLAWLVTYILTPLLQHVPSRLSDIHQQLENLSTVSPEEIAGLNFCSGDISSLYTNINIQACIDDVIEFAAENKSSLPLCGITLTDIHEILELVLGDWYFCYNNRVYLQLIGLFMGCKQSPICAIIRIYSFEKRSIFTDISYISVPYGRYIDDAYTMTRTVQLQAATNYFNSVADQDPDNLLKWEIDFPNNNMEYVPFLGTQIRVDTDGTISHKFYRNSQKKNITLHYNSHHPLKRKVEVVRNFYKIAERSSSSQELAEESSTVIDHLLRCNGYANPRLFRETNVRRPKLGYLETDCFILFQVEGVKKDETVCLKVLYISEFVSYEILRFVKRRGFKVSVTFTPGRKLQDIFCKSRPLDGLKCTSNNCNICQMLEDNVSYETSHPVYMITCNLCNEVYIGESSRTLSHRLSEHLRYARNPNSTNYRDEALAVHYRDQHAGLQPSLSFKLLAVELSTITRKISEALYIQRFNPRLNDKEECVTLIRFLICS